MKFIVNAASELEQNDSYRGVAQLVGRLLWGQDAGGSSPSAPTNGELTL